MDVDTFKSNISVSPFDQNHSKGHDVIIMLG